MTTPADLTIRAVMGAEFTGADGKPYRESLLLADGGSDEWARKRLRAWAEKAADAVERGDRTALDAARGVLFQ